MVEVVWFVNAQRRGWLRTAAGLPWLLVSYVVGTEAFAQPSAVALARLERAQARRDAMRDLVRKWKEVAYASGTLDRLAERMDEKWGEITAAHRSDVRSVQQATDAAPRLRGAIESRTAALNFMQAAAKQARDSVARISRADSRALNVVMRDGDATFKDRRRGEAAFEELGRHLSDAGLAGFQAALIAQRNVVATRTKIVKLQQDFDSLIEGQSSLNASIASANAAQRLAQQANWLSGAAEPAARAMQAVPGLKDATTLALKAYPAVQLPSVSDWTAVEHNKELGDRAAEFERMLDAVAYLELVGGPTSGSMSAEYADLVKQRGRAETALASARAQLIKDSADTEVRLADSSAAVRSQQRAIEQLGGLVLPASDEARRMARQVSAEVEALLPAVESAERSAIAEWEEAYLGVYGTTPLKLQVEPPAPGIGPPRGLPPAKAAAPPRLVGHAYDFFDDWDKERDGYGAYTYVLLRSAGDLQSAAVRSRYERLLEVLQRQTDARDVPSDAARSLNLFCIPVRATRERSLPDLSYSSALGNQVKLRLQTGLFTRTELRGRLTNSTGPFLLTLPLRVNAADSSSALLFADLSDYPEGAIRDLAVAYMGTLLQDFPQQQALWKPPVPQRVALSMIWFASETSALLQTAIPAAQAKPNNT